MWCSRRNARLLFYLGVMLFMIGLGLIVMEKKVPGAIFLCLGIVPLMIGFLVTITHVVVESKMRKKKAEKAAESVKMEEPTDEEKPH